MSKEKPKRIVLHGCYSASNADLGIKDKNGILMKGEHDVFVMTKSDKNGFVKVKTITSLENVKSNGTKSFHENALDDVKNGIIIPIPIKEMNAPKLSGVNRKPFWIHKNKLYKPNRGFKYPTAYSTLLIIDKK